MNREVVLSRPLTLVFLAVMAGICVGALLHVWWVERKAARAGEEPRPWDPIFSRFAGEGVPVDVSDAVASTGDALRSESVRATRLRPGDVVDVGEFVEVVRADFGVDADGWHNVHVVARTPSGATVHRWFGADQYVVVQRALEVA